MRAFLATAIVCLLAGCTVMPLRSQAKYYRHAQAQHDVTAAALAEGVPVNIAHGVAQTESGYNDASRSKSGAAGIMQVLPRTAASVGESVHSYWGRLRAGMKYLHQALDRRGLSLCEKLSAYNRGLFARPRCTAYGREVLRRAGQ